MKKTAAFLLIGLIAILLLPRDTAEPKRYQTGFFDLFDTYTELTVYASGEAEATAIAAMAKDELTVCHRLFDIYNAYEGVNNLQTVNQNAGIMPVRVDPRIIDLLLFGKEIYAATGGQVNIAMGSVLELWHEKRAAGIEDPENAALPDMEALREAARHMNIDDLVIDERAMTVYLKDGAMRLDVGAIAKGFATERAAQTMVANGAESALLSVGGNVRAIGPHADGTPWQVGIQNPDLSAGAGSIATVALENRSMVTSGSYQRYYMVDGKRYHHIIDPQTLMPSEYVQSVTVLAVDSGVADALSTALFTVSVEQGAEILKRFDGAEAFWIGINGEMIKSGGFVTE
jgi:thiamine biosynthesis lipoprotein